MARRFDSQRRQARRYHLGAVLGVLNAPGVLLRTYGETDKGEHGYMPYYRLHLGPYRLRRNVVFEIGVGRYARRSAGGSLAVWRDYLVRSTIVGIDIYEKSIDLGRRVNFVRADQNESDQLQVAVDVHGAPDVVIDDGSHVGEHIMTSFRCLWPQVRPGGLYVVEDLTTSYGTRYGGAHPAPDETGVGLGRQLVSDVQASDHGFRMHPEVAAPPVPRFADVAAVHAYPGILFVVKAGARA